MSAYTLTTNLKDAETKMRGIISVVSGAVAMALSVSIFAQSSNNKCEGAVLRDVVGNVLVSTKDGMGAGIEKQSVANHTRVTTTARASVTISFECGCDVKLKENEQIDIESPNTCAAFLAAITPVPIAGAIGAATASAGTFSGTTALVAVGVGGILIYRLNISQSPN